MREDVAGKIGGDDDLRAERACRRHRHRIDQGAVDEPAVADQYRREYSRQRIGSAHRVDHAARGLSCLENLSQLRVFDHAGQAVGADQVQVTVPQVALEHVRLDGCIRPDASRDHVAVRVVPRLLRGEEAGVHLLLHVGVVLGDLPELPVAHEVHTRVSDMADDPATASHEETRCGRAHALLVGLYYRALVNGAVGLTQRGGHARQRLHSGKVTEFRQLAGHDLYGHLTGNLAGCVAAHTIGDDEQPPLGISVGIKAVFVTSANAPDVGTGGDGKLHVDRVVLTRGKSLG